jgi:hypothetical protein
MVLENLSEILGKGNKYKKFKMIIKSKKKKTNGKLSEVLPRLVSI